MNRLIAFITGSYAYGKPDRRLHQSDIDLVIFCDEETKALLRTHGGVKMRFGKLQVIPCTNETEYAIWHEGTEKLKTEAPVMRERAVAVFEALEAEAGTNRVTRYKENCQ